MNFLVYLSNKVKNYLVLEVGIFVIICLIYFVYFIRINYWVIFNKFGIGYEELDFKYFIY